MRHFFYFILQFLGNFLILGGILLLLLHFSPVFLAQVAYKLQETKGVSYTTDSDEATIRVDEESPFGLLLAKPGKALIVPASSDFGLVIEKIGVNIPVVANIDASDPTTYLEALKDGAAHARGTVFPGQRGNSYIFAHSALNFWQLGKYANAFVLLDKLQIGDKATAFYRGKRFVYEVVEKRVVGPSDTTFLSADYDTPVLTLQTCDPPGTTWQRLVIVAALV